MGQNDGSVGLTTRVVGLAVGGGGSFLFLLMQWYEAAKAAGWMLQWWLVAFAGLGALWVAVVRWQVVRPILRLSCRKEQWTKESAGVPRGDLPAELRTLQCTMREVLQEAEACSEGERRSAERLQQLVGSMLGQWRVLKESTEAQARSLDEGLEEFQTLHSHLVRLSETADRVLQHSQGVEKDVGELAQLLSGGRKTTGEVGTATSALLTRGREILSALDEMENQVHGFERATQAAASSVVRVNELAKTVTGSARELERTTSELNQVAAEGAEVVNEVDSHARDTTQAVLESAEIVRDLGSRSEEIGAVVQVIESIADETNLLALNAAIIAAQAGEHGKSFAVVAEEIRELAERSSSSTKEVADLVKGVQDGIGQATRSIHESAEKVRQSADLAGRAGSIWEKVRSGSERNARLAEAIALSSAEQCSGADKLGTAIEGVVNAIDGIGKRVRVQKEIENRATNDLSGLQSLTRQLDAVEPRTWDQVARLESEVRSASALLSQVAESCSLGSGVTEDIGKKLDEACDRVREQMRALKRQANTLQLQRGRDPAFSNEGEDALGFLSEVER